MKRIILYGLEYLGEVVLLIIEVLKRVTKIPHAIHHIIDQMHWMGVGSLAIIGVTFFFAGGVTTYQAAYQGAAYLPQIYVGMSAAKAFLITLGALLCALMLAGRIGSAMASELGTMRVTEQIDALETMAMDPIRYLVLPRLVASMVVTPALTLYALVIYSIGGLVVAITMLNIPANIFIEGLRTNFMPHEFWGCLIKALVFGWWIGIMSCYHGLKTTGGAEGVGRAATRAVVSSSIMVLAFEFIITRLIY